MLINPNNKQNQEIIIKYQQQFLEYNKKINLLNQENIILKNKINELNQENINLKNQKQQLINLLNTQKNNYMPNNLNYNCVVAGGKGNLMESINQLVIQKEKELSEIKSALPFELKKGEKLMTLIFFSTDQKIHYALICKNTDSFGSVEEKLFKVFPECQEETYFFLANGSKINRYKTINELKLKNSEIITMDKCMVE